MLECVFVSELVNLLLSLSLSLSLSVCVYMYAVYLKEKKLWYTCKCVLIEENGVCSLQQKQVSVCVYAVYLKEQFAIYYNKV